MDVVSLCPLRATSFVWQNAPGRHVRTVVCKATFRLAPGQSTLAEEQEPPNETDDHWDDDPARSVFAPTDLAPRKARADVVLVGHAFAPHDQPARSVVVRFIVGGIDKSIEVFRDRAVVQGELRVGSSFRKMPLAYERAAGGPDTWNPAGVRPDNPSGRLPNLQPPGLGPSPAAASIAPIGFGPIAPTWPTRVDRLGRHAPTVSAEGWRERGLPEDFDISYFNVAPPDQQLESLRGDEPILLEGLLAQHARLVTRLSGVRPRVVVELASGGGREVPMVCDTLWIDTDRALATLTWRGQIPGDLSAEAGRILVSMADGAQPEFQSSATADDEEPESLEPDELGGSTIAVPAAHMSESGPLQPAPASPPATMAVPAVDLRRVMPFMPALAVPPTPGQEAASTAPTSVREASPPPPERLETSAISEMTGPLPAASGLGLTFSDSPWAAAGERAEALPFVADRAPTPPSVPVAVAAPVPVPAASTRLPSSPPISVSALSAAAASDAAAAASPWTDPGRDTLVDIRPTVQRVRPRELLDLLWLDPSAAARAKKRPAWRELVDALENQPADPDLDGEKTAIDSRRELFEVLAKAPPTDALGVEDALLGAIRADGKFAPPLVLVAGELRFSFDDRERLKALSLLAARHAAADKKLKEAVDAATEALADPAITGASGIPSALAARIEEALPPRGPVASEVLASSTRMLLEARHFAKRPVFGAPHLRCSLDTGTGTAPLVVYLPEDAAPKLPLFQRITARILVEVHVRQDEVESHPTALRACALARVVHP